ncbi:hypothetical protein [Pseudomonas palleroniana]|uniref:hypothetical protein n=1 Tax=Pseudomonas palleroniana TaxID=191390 RepID=UPI0011AE4FFC|nr:hypothetical protein [Pseudomonas palleroniana]
MNRDEIAASVDLIKASLLKRGNETITGALLGELIRKVTPELNLRHLYPAGQKVLTRFIKDYCSEFLSALQRQGGDVLYSIIPDSGESARQSSVNATPFVADYDYWVTFARPNTSSNVFVSQESLAIFVSASKALSSDWVMVESVTPSEMVNIRRLFIEGLNPGSFDSSVYSYDGSYSDWLESVRGCGGSLFNQWSVFRIAKLHELFKSRLEKLGVCGDSLHSLCQIMKRSQESQPKKSIVRKNDGELKSFKSSVASSSSAQSPTYDADLLRSEEIFRSAVVEAVKHMSLAEMRALNIPIGLFMDSVNIILNK